MMTKWQAEQKNPLGFILGAVSHTLVEKVMFRLIAFPQPIAPALVIVNPSVSLHPSLPPPVPLSVLSMGMRATCSVPGRELVTYCAHSSCRMPPKCYKDSCLPHCQRSPPDISSLSIWWAQLARVSPEQDILSE